MAEQYKQIATELNNQVFFDRVFKVGNLQTKILVLMFLNRKDWTTNELAEECGNYRPNVFMALKDLEKKGIVFRLGYTRWKTV